MNSLSFIPIELRSKKFLSASNNLDNINIHQSPLYARFMHSINWKVEKIDDVYIYIKQVPLFGSIIKIQRSNKLPNLDKLKRLINQYHARSIIFEPQISCQLSAVSCQLINDPYLPTKTIHIDLTANENEIFNRFSSAKRRAIRRADKLGVIVKTSSNINDFVKLKNQTAGFLGFLTTTTLKPLWQCFAPNNISILLAFLQEQKYVAGILMLFWKNTAYYWMAASTKQGDKNYAPSLLVWQALKLAKKKGCNIFDFEGIYDERFPSVNKNWLGFTKFKNGFGGKEIYYPQPIEIKF